MTLKNWNGKFVSSELTQRKKLKKIKKVNLNTKISIIGLEDQIYENEINFDVYKIINKKFRKVHKRLSNW